MRRAQIATHVVFVACGAFVLLVARADTTNANSDETSAQQAVCMLMRQYKAKLDGTLPPADWPQKLRKPDKWTWVVDMDTSQLPGGYPEQIVVAVGSRGGDTGKAVEAAGPSAVPAGADTQSAPPASQPGDTPANEPASGASAEQDMLVPTQGAHLKCSGGSILDGTPCPMLAEVAGGTMTVYRVGDGGEVRRLGQHPVGAQDRPVLVPGTGRFYAIFSRKPEGEAQVRVYSSGREEYVLPAKLANPKGGVISVLAVLDSGSLLVQCSQGNFMEIPGKDEPVSLAIMSRSAGVCESHSVYDGPPALESPHVAGNGKAVAIACSKPCRTVVYSSRDASELARIEGFVATDISYDSLTLVGWAGSDFAVYKNAQLTAKRPMEGSFRFMNVAANGEYAVECTSWKSLAVLGTTDLRKLYSVTAAPESDRISGYAVSAGGRLAWLEIRRPQAQMPGKAVRVCRLTVHNAAGTEILKRSFAPCEQFPISSLAWTLDGKALLFQEPADGPLKRLVFAQEILKEIKSRGDPKP